MDILPRKTGWQDELLKSIAKPNHDTTGLVSSQQREFAEFVAKNSSPLKVIPKSANDSAPRSMNTKAYKVLNDDGSAIFDRSASFAPN